MIAGLKRRPRCDICGGKKEPWQDFCSKCRLDLQKHLERADAHIRTHRKVYAVSIAGDPSGPVKFGFSSNPVDRLDHMQIGSPVRLELLAACDATFNVEQAIHKFLADSWHHGEWFTRNEKVNGVIDAIRERRVKSHIGMYGADPPIVSELKRQIADS